MASFVVASVTLVGAVGNARAADQARGLKAARLAVDP